MKKAVIALAFIFLAGSAPQAAALKLNTLLLISGRLAGQLPRTQ